MKKFILSLLTMLMCLTLNGFAQENTKEFTLKVSDRKGKPIKNLDLAAFIKSNAEDVKTLDRKGILVFSSVNDADTLGIAYGSEIYEFSLNGLDSLQIFFKNKKQIERILADNKPLVNTGYTVHSLDNYPYPINFINVKNIENYLNLADYMLSRVPGVVVKEAVDGYTVAINGLGNVYTNNEPLVIVDGVTMRNFNAANQFVNPRDIKNITVDKQGTIYGSRGANGAIIITTNNGR